MKISDLAKRTGVSTQALRHYERLRLLEPVPHANGYRHYTESMRREVVIIAMSRKIGFSLAAIAERLPTHHANGVSPGRLYLSARPITGDGGICHC